MLTLVSDGFEKYHALHRIFTKVTLSIFVSSMAVSLKAQVLKIQDVSCKVNDFVSRLNTFTTRFLHSEYESRCYVGNLLYLKTAISC